MDSIKLNETFISETELLKLGINFENAELFCKAIKSMDNKIVELMSNFNLHSDHISNIIASSFFIAHFKNKMEIDIETFKVCKSHFWRLLSSSSVSLNIPRHEFENILSRLNFHCILLERGTFNLFENHFDFYSLAEHSA